MFTKKTSGFNFRKVGELFFPQKSLPGVSKKLDPIQSVEQGGNFRPKASHQAGPPNVKNIAYNLVSSKTKA